MPQPAAQPHVQQSFHSLTEAGNDVVRPFERALSGSNVIPPARLWPAVTPQSGAALSDGQRRSCELMAQPWRRVLASSGQELRPVAAPAKHRHRAYTAVEPVCGRDRKIKRT